MTWIKNSGVTNLGSLSDVDVITTLPTNNDVLTYDSTKSKWVPKAATGAGNTTAIPTYVIELRRWSISNDGTNPLATTQGINNALSWAGTNGYKKVMLPAGTYSVASNSQINLVSNIHFILDENALIQKESNGLVAYNIVYVGANINNVTISGGEIRGDRYSHNYSAPGTHENSYCLLVEGATNVLIERIKLTQCTGDGLAVGSKNLGFVRDIFETNLEQGGIDDSGNLLADPTRIRTKVTFNLVNGVFAANPWQKNFTLINFNNLTRKGINVYFYKSDNTFLSYTKNKESNEIINIPQGAAYCKVTLNQPNVPNVGDGMKRFVMNALAICYRVTVRQCDIGFNRRQAITIGGVYYMTVDSNVLHDTGGTAPQAGIDVEGGANPNWYLYIVNNTFINNVGYDINLFDGKFQYIGNNQMGSASAIASLSTNNSIYQYEIIGNNILGPVSLSASDGRFIGNTVSNNNVIIDGTNITINDLTMYKCSFVVTPPNPFDITVMNVRMIGGGFTLNTNAAHCSDIDINRGSFSGNVTNGIPTFNNMRIYNSSVNGIPLCQGIYNSCTFASASDVPTSGYGAHIRKAGKYILKNCHFRMNTWLLEVVENSDVEVNGCTFEALSDLSWGRAVIYVQRSNTIKLINNVINAPNQSSLNFSVVKINGYGSSTDNVLEAHIIRNIIKTPVACKGISTSEGMGTTSYYVSDNIVQGCFLDLRDIDTKYGNVDNGKLDPYNYSNSTPTSSNYKLGQQVFHSSPTPGGYLGWVCTTAGYANNQTWTASTNYIQGARVNSGGHVFEVQNNGKSTITSPTFPTASGATVNDTAGSIPWAASSAYNVGKLVVPSIANGCYYECTSAGASGTAEPVWSTTSGATVADGTIIWTARKIITWKEISLLAVFKQFGSIQA